MYGSYYLLLANKLLSLQPVVRTRRCYTIVGLVERQKSFQGLATYGHEVLMSLQTRATFLGTHSTMPVTVSMTRDASRLDTLWAEAFFFERVHNNE
jgi:hypothetical protein